MTEIGAAVSVGYESGIRHAVADAFARRGHALALFLDGRLPALPARNADRFHGFFVAGVT